MQSEFLRPHSKHVEPFKRMSVDEGPPRKPRRSSSVHDKPVRLTLRHKHLGPLERGVMDVVWELNECSVRDVVQRMAPKRAYTTVMTTLSRLYRKGILRRDEANHKFLYSARLNRRELEDSIARDLIMQLLAVDPASRESMITFLVDKLRERDPALWNKIMARTSEMSTDTEEVQN
jgi:predicted transcriptional regulator